MSGEIARLLFGDGKQKDSVEQAERARVVREDVRLAGLKVDGAVALAGHAMNGLIELDKYRQDVAKGDITHNLILAEIEEAALAQVKSIQRGIFNSWGLSS